MKNTGKAISILLRGSSKLVLEELERSLHDALCVIRCLVKKRAVLSGNYITFFHIILKGSVLYSPPNLRLMIHMIKDQKTYK